MARPQITNKTNNNSSCQTGPRPRNNSKGAVRLVGIAVTKNHQDRHRMTTASSFDSFRMRSSWIGLWTATKKTHSHLFASLIQNSISPSSNSSSTLPDHLRDSKRWSKVSLRVFILGHLSKVTQTTILALIIIFKVEKIKKAVWWLWAMKVGFQPMGLIR